MRDTQTIQQARRLAKEADQSERQAEDYLLIAEAIRSLNIDPERREDEAKRYDRLAEEFYEDADERRGLVEPELIDAL